VQREDIRHPVDTHARLLLKHAKANVLELSKLSALQVE
jgi:hypothetical protein